MSDIGIALIGLVVFLTVIMVWIHYPTAGPSDLFLAALKESEVTSQAKLDRIAEDEAKIKINQIELDVWFDLEIEKPKHRLEIKLYSGEVLKSSAYRPWAMAYSFGIIRKTSIEVAKEEAEDILVRKYFENDNIMHPISAIECIKVVQAE